MIKSFLQKPEGYSATKLKNAAKKLERIGWIGIRINRRDGIVSGYKTHKKKKYKIVIWGIRILWVYLTASYTIYCGKKVIWKSNGDKHWPSLKEVLKRQ